MKKLFTFIFSVVLVLAPLNAQAYEVGIIDEYKLLTEYKQSKDAQERIAALRAKIQDLLVALNKEIEEASKNKKLTKTQLEAKQKEAEKQLLDEKAKAESVANSLRQDVETKVRVAINEVAKAKNIDLIITAETAYYGGNDITDDVLRKLNN